MTSPVFTSYKYSVIKVVYLLLHYKWTLKLL